MKIIQTFLLIAAALFIFCAMTCDSEDCCEEEVVANLSGEILYDGYQGGPIVIEVCEDVSNRCAGTGGQSQTPGICPKRIELDAPGSFEIAARIKWLGPRPTITIYAYNDADGDGVCQEETDAGKSIALTAMDHQGLQIVLEPGNCANRQ